jgi:hypothetical protein
MQIRKKGDEIKKKIFSETIEPIKVLSLVMSAILDTGRG